MKFNGQAELDYQLPEFEITTATDIPLTPSQLEKWLSELPILNTNQLAYQIPKYIQDLNRVKLSDKQRFNMLEQLRPIVAHIHQSLTKYFRGSNLSLSTEHKEIQWLINVLMAEMAIGYQHLLFSLAKNNPSLFSRSQYVLLVERTAYYLSEKICLSYLLSTAVPDSVWKELNATYAYARKLKLNKKKLKDEFAFFAYNKGNIDSIYNRILLLSLVSPYSLRSAEIEQIYFGMLPWLNGIKLLNSSKAKNGDYIIDLKQDTGPKYQETGLHSDDKHLIDCSGLLSNLKAWLATGNAPKSANHKGMSKKLLNEVISKLESTKQRKDERLHNQGDRVEVVIGLRNIDVFLGHITSLIEEQDSPIPEIRIDKDADKLILNDDNSDWDTLHFYAPKDAPKQRHESGVTSIEESKEPEVRRHIFNIENESERGVCLSCSDLHGTGLYIGELMFIRGFDPETWTLGIIRWMTLHNKKLKVGLYLLSAQVERVIVGREGVAGDDVTINALWMAEGEHGDTILLPSAEFNTGDELLLDHKGDELEVTLGKVVWNSEGFSQFCIIANNVDVKAGEAKKTF